MVEDSEAVGEAGSSAVVQNKARDVMGADPWRRVVTYQEVCPLSCRSEEPSQNLKGNEMIKIILPEEEWERRHKWEDPIGDHDKAGRKVMKSRLRTAAAETGRKEQSERHLLETK